MVVCFFSAGCFFVSSVTYNHKKCLMADLCMVWLAWILPCVFFAVIVVCPLSFSAVYRINRFLFKEDGKLNVYTDRVKLRHWIKCEYRLVMRRTESFTCMGEWVDEEQKMRCTQSSNKWWKFTFFSFARRIFPLTTSKRLCSRRDVTHLLPMYIYAFLHVNQ